MYSSTLMIKMFGILAASLLLLAEATVFAETSSQQKIEQPASTYRLRPLDLLEIKVFQEPDLDKRVRISANGSIAMPLIGNVHLAGLSLQDAQQRIKELYEKDYLVRAFVTIFIAEYSPQRVHVIGQVFRNGEVRFPNEEPMTLSKAIADAGGPTRIADIRNVKVKRKMADGSVQVFNVSLKAILNDKDAKDFPLCDGDTIEVPEDIF